MHSPSHKPAPLDLHLPPQVEATKFTEVGYHGRDVDSIIKDLVDNAMALVRGKLRERSAARIAEAVRQRILQQLQPAEGRGGSVSQELQDQYEWVAGHYCVGLRW